MSTAALSLVLPDGRRLDRTVQTAVTFKVLSHEETEDYIASGEWRGKAGGYAIQGRAAALIRWIGGSYSNVVGLPLFEVSNMLYGAGFVSSARCISADWTALTGKIEILIDRAGPLVRAAVVEDGRLTDLHIDSDDRPSRLGAIVLGRVERIVTALNGAFVDIGGPSAGLLNASRPAHLRPDQPQGRPS